MVPEHMEMPKNVDLVVPQEITLTTPWLKAVAVYMGVHCEKEMNEFMLLRREFNNDPRRVLKEGKAVTACGVNFIRQLRKACLQEVTEYAQCLDHAQGGEMLPVYCRRKQYPLDICVEEKMGIKRPPLGHFSRMHVHESKIKPPPPSYDRDFFAEANKLMAELPADWHIDVKRFRHFRPPVYDMGSSDY